MGTHPTCGRARSAESRTTEPSSAGASPEHGVVLRPMLSAGASFPVHCTSYIGPYQVGPASRAGAEGCQYRGPDCNLVTTFRSIRTTRSRSARGTYCMYATYGGPGTPQDSSARVRLWLGGLVLQRGDVEEQGSLFVGVRQGDFDCLLRLDLLHAEVVGYDPSARLHDIKLGY